MVTGKRGSHAIVQIDHLPPGEQTGEEEENIVGRIWLFCSGSQLPSNTFNKQAVQLNCWTKKLDLESSIQGLEHSESAKRAERDYNILLIVTNGFRH